MHIRIYTIGKMSLVTYFILFMSYIEFVHIPSPRALDKFMSKVLPAMDRAFPFSAAVIPDGKVTRSMCDAIKRSRVCTMSADRVLCSSTVFNLAIKSVSFNGGRMSLLILTTDNRSPKTLNPVKISPFCK